MKECVRIKSLIILALFTNYGLEGKIALIIFVINVCLILLMKRFHCYAQTGKQNVFVPFR
jgi:hypothetical protein